MPFKVRCRLVAFMGDVERFPCHFDYKIGDEFTYNGEKFEGRICDGLLASMVEPINETLYSGNKHHERILFRYSGLSAKDPSMKKYDGIGFRSIKEVPKGADEKYTKLYSAERPTKLMKGRAFVCQDSRTSALFRCEPIGLADGGHILPYYKREIDILEKIKKDPGLNVDEILAKYTEWEREEIYPPLTPLNVSLILDELVEVNYIELREGRAYPQALP